MLKKIKKLFKEHNKGMILLTLMLFSMMMLAMGMTMLYQAESNFQLSATSRDSVEVFMTAETAYESCVTRIIYNMDTHGFDDHFKTSWPSDTTGWPNYLLRVYDDPTNPTKFRLVEQPAIDFYDDQVVNRNLGGAADVSDDNANPLAFIINRSDSVSAGDVFKVDNRHFYRAWFEADRYQDNSPEDHTAYLMVEAFRGNATASVDPSDPNFIPQSHVLMQYRIKLLKYTSVYEGGDTSQYGEGAGGTGAAFSGGAIDTSTDDRTRVISLEDE